MPHPNYATPVPTPTPIKKVTIAPKLTPTATPIPKTTPTPQPIKKPLSATEYNPALWDEPLQNIADAYGQPFADALKFILIHEGHGNQIGKGDKGIYGISMRESSNEPDVINWAKQVKSGKKIDISPEEALRVAVSQLGRYYKTSQSKQSKELPFSKIVQIIGNQPNGTAKLAYMFGYGVRFKPSEAKEQLNKFFNKSTLGQVDEIIAPSTKEELSDKHYQAFADLYKQITNKEPTPRPQPINTPQSTSTPLRQTSLPKTTVSGDTTTHPNPLKNNYSPTESNLPPPPTNQPKIDLPLTPTTSTSSSPLNPIEQHAQQRRLNPTTQEVTRMGLQGRESPIDEPTYPFTTPLAPNYTDAYQNDANFRNYTEDDLRKNALTRLYGGLTQPLTPNMAKYDWFNDDQS